MKIGIFTNNYLPNPYGVAGSVESFREEFEKKGHEVFVFAPRWKGYIDGNPRVFRYPSFETNVKIRFPLGIPCSRKMDKILDNLSLDIVHSQHPNLLGSAAVRWARKKNIPLVFTWHTLYDQYAHFAPFVPKKIAVWWLVRNARNYANRCDAVVVPTPSVAEIIKKWQVTNENITAIPTGVDEDEFANPDGKAVRKKYGIADDEILLFVLTRFTSEKNMEFLFECAIQALKNNKKVKFMASGRGDLENVLRKKVADAGMEDRVIFPGHVRNDLRKNYYAAGDIFVYASKSETQGMVLTEAMYAGLPIVAVRATGVKDIVKDGRTGFLVSGDKKKFSNAAEKLINSAELRKKFGEEAKHMAKERYTSKVCAEKMLQVYVEAVNSKRKNQNF